MGFDPGLGTGALIGRTIYRPGATQQLPVTSSTHVDVDATNLVMGLRIPNSGLVLVELDSFAEAIDSTMEWGIREGSTLKDNVEVAFGHAGGIMTQMSAAFYIADTPGRDVVWKWSFARTFGSGATNIRFGQRFGPAVMRATVA